ncbi:MAG TPA: hypothetical protein DCL77_15250 [Prolixibacteraceae bacterium]|nr:hypothetical protein [Prolixibacteraceae bacterium]
MAGYEKDTGMKGIQSLFKNKELYRILIENSSDAIFFTENSQIIDCNEAAVLMFGLNSKEEFNGTFPFDYSPECQPDGTPSKIKAEQLVFKSNQKSPQHICWTHVKSNGNLFDTKIVLHSFEHESRTMLHFSITDIGTDELLKVSGVGQLDSTKETSQAITEKSQADAKLKLSFSLLQATLDSTADGILVVDHSGKITSFNKQFKTTFDLSDELLESRDDKTVMESVLGKLKYPVQFVSKVHYLYNHPEIESFDTIELNDGRTIERYSRPQLLNGQPIGRVWSFRDITDRKKVEQQLYLMAHTIKSIRETITITDNDDRILFVNAAFLKTYGYQEEELIGKHISFIRTPDQDPGSIRQIMNSSSSSTWQGEIMNRKKDGSDVLTSLSASIVQNEKEEELGMVGIGVDISEQKMAERKLRESEERYRLLIENQGEGISIVDQNETFIFANPAAEYIFGVQAGELINRNLNEFIPVEQFHTILNESKLRTEIIKSTYEVEIVTPEGIHKNLLVTAAPQTNDEGQCIGTFGVFRDISDRKQAEEKLRLSEMKYRNLIETMPDGVYRSTPEGKFVEANPAMVKMLGYESKEELMAIDIKSQLYFDPADRESIVLEEELEEMGIFRLKKKDGSEVWIEDHGTYITDNNGKILFHEGILRDITERKMAEIQLHKYSNELRELNATKDKFFSIIAHDLKSPFNSISGLSEIIKSEAGELDIATIEQYAGIINSTSIQTFRLLENLLDWARLHQSQIIFRHVSVNLKGIVDEIFELMFEKAQSKKIELSNFIPELLIITADQDMLKTILRNLVSNALKFTSSKGNIGVNAVVRAHEIEISVKDTGIGIKKEDMDKLFKVGSIFSERGTENETGTGLGLMLCKEFAEKHGGRIWVESEKGKGSTFIFTISQNSQNK